MDVKVIEINNRGQTRLSRKEVLLEENPELALTAATVPKEASGDKPRGPRPGGRGGGKPKRDAGGF